MASQFIRLPTLIMIVALCVSCALLYAFFVQKNPELPGLQQGSEETSSIQKNKHQQPEKFQQQAATESNTDNDSSPISSLASINCDSLDWLEPNNHHNDIDNYFQSLGNSEIPSERLYHALFAVKKDDDKLDDLLAINRIEHPLVALNIVRLCAVTKEHEGCDDALIENIIDYHQHDGLMWQYAIHYYAKINQSDLVVKAIERSIQANYRTFYRSDFFVLHNQVLEDAGQGDYIANTIAAIGQEAASSYAIAETVNWCKSNMGEQKFIKACLDMGRHWEVNSDVIVDKSLGISIQNLIYEAEGNVELAEEAKLKNEALYNEIRNWEDSAIVFSSEDLIKEYLNLYPTFGEAGAIKALKNDIESYKKTDFYQRCVEPIL